MSNTTRVKRLIAAVVPRYRSGKLFNGDRWRSFRWFGRGFDYFGKAIEVEPHHFNTREMDEGFEPIPLTEEWLKKFGFEKMSSPRSITYHCNCFKIKQELSGKWWIARVGGSSPTHQVKIEYVHQLQNLYFALTGEELELNQSS